MRLAGPAAESRVLCCCLQWGNKTTSSMFAKHAESEATAQPMAQMVALAISRGWLVTPGVVDPTAAAKLVG